MDLSANTRLVTVPGYYSLALLEGRASEAVQHEPMTCLEHYGRALCWIALGCDLDAVRDLDAAQDELQGWCEIEKVLIGLRVSSQPVEQLRQSAEKIALDTSSHLQLRARAWHILGMIQNRMRCVGDAMDSLMTAAKLYQDLKNYSSRATVMDSLGLVESDRGRTDLALVHFATSLIDKTNSGDKYGTAITLGNIGRTQFKLGRYGDALESFTKNLEISKSLGDRIGLLSMLNWIGRTYTELSQFDEANTHLNQCVTLASASSADVRFEFFARKDLCDSCIRAHKLEAAIEQYSHCCELTSRLTGAYFLALTQYMLGQIRFSQTESGCQELFLNSVNAFADLDLPELEIQARIDYARACIANGKLLEADDSLTRAQRLASSDGFAAHLTTVNEAICEMGRTASIARGTSSRDGFDCEAVSQNYILRERLGEGGFGEVFRAIDTRRSREVAYKRIKLSGKYDSKQLDVLIASARRELESVSNLMHPGIVRVYAIGSEPNGNMYLVQEFVSGGSLRSVLSAGQRGDTSSIIKTLIKISQSLEVLHHHGVIHRDLKPENILMRNATSPVLVDFGVSLMQSSNSILEHRIMGTFQYMAPEQAAGETITGKADLYSLGVITYEWLVGCRPYRLTGLSRAEIVKQIKTIQPATLHKIRPDLPLGLISLVMSLIEKKPRRRPADASEVIAKLQACMSNCSTRVG